MNPLKSKNLSALHLYIRSLSAVCLKGHLAYYFTLNKYGGIRESIFARKMLSNRLRKDWQIENEQVLKSKLSWLLNEGRRQEFNETRYHLLALSELDRNDYLKTLPQKSKDTSKIRIVNTFMRTLPTGGIAAFDFAQYIYLCRVGNTLRYLTNQEAQKRMINVARLIQQSYSGWNEYVTAYAAGSQFAAADTSSYVRNNNAFIIKLFAAEDSPLRKVDWHMDLDTFGK